MNRAIVCVLLLAAVLALSSGQDSFADKLEHINVEEILKNPRLLKNYIDCMLSDSNAHCTADGKELKKSLPAALKDGCSKCTDKQKAQGKRVMNILRDQHPSEWKQLTDKYDPTGDLVKKYAATLDS